MSGYFGTFQTGWLQGYEVVWTHLVPLSGRFSEERLHLYEIPMEWRLLEPTCLSLKTATWLDSGPPQSVFRGHGNNTNCLFKSGFKGLTHFSISLLEVGDRRGSLQSWKVSTYSICSCISLDLSCFDFCWLLFWGFCV